jgi:hypothetical protein
MWGKSQVRDDPSTLTSARDTTGTRPGWKKALIPREGNKAELREAIIRHNNERTGQ